MLLYKYSGNNGNNKQSSGIIKYLGEAGSYDIKSILPEEDYKTLTENNFILMPKNNLNTPSRKTGNYNKNCSGMDFGVNVSATSTYNCNKSYNKETGIFTCSISTSAGNPGMKVYFCKDIYE